MDGQAELTYNRYMLGKTVYKIHDILSRYQGNLYVAGQLKLI